MRVLELATNIKDRYVVGRNNDFLEGIEVTDISIPSRGSENEVWVAAAFEYLSVELEREMLAEAEKVASPFPPRVLCVVPLYQEEDSLEQMRVTSAVGGFSSVIGMLILAFPEVHWVIPHIWDEGRARIKEWVSSENFSSLSCWELLESAHLELESAVQLAVMGFSPLFDPAGLRQIILHNLVDCPRCSRGTLRHGKSRYELVGVVEDEPSYLYFLGYAAYKGGRRCNLMYNYRLLEKSLHPRRLDITHHTFIEDIYLDFSDKPRTISLALGQRAREFPGFGKAATRVFVTNGGKRREWTAERTVIAADLGFSVSLTNRIRTRLLAFRAEIKNSRGIRCRIVSIWHLFKSAARLLKVWRAVRKSRLEFESQFTIIFKPVSSLHEVIGGAGFDGWAGLESGNDIAVDTSNESHQVPGHIREIAAVLSGRSRRQLSRSGDPTMATYGALLALQAQELLVSRIPSMSFELIAARHVNELNAESLFYGTDAILNIDSRLKEVRREVNVAAQQVSRANRRQARLNAEARIVNDLIILLRDRNYFDAELRCLRRLFELECWLRWSRRKGVMGKLWGFFPSLAGFIIGRFVTSVPLSLSLAVILVSAAAWGFSAFGSSSANAWSWALDAFSGGDLPSNLGDCRGSSPAWMWIASRYAGVGFLGILISLILFRLTRR